MIEGDVTNPHTREQQMNKAWTCVWALAMFCGLTAKIEAVEILSDRQAMHRARQAIEQNDPRFMTAYQSLVQQADRALQRGPFSVTFKKRQVPSGDPHDYISVGPYWWPNPDTQDGLPYVRRDGEVNPQSRDDTFDSRSKVAMSGSVNTLALAYFYTGDERYAQHAAHLLRTWFIDEATRMNPHLRYAQAIPGHVDGRGTGIIDTSHWTTLLDSVLLLKPSPHWSDADHKALQDWFRRFTHWLKTSDNGRSIERGHQNISVWYDAQVVAASLFIGEPEQARSQILDWTTRRIADHIAEDGSQPPELARTRSWSYSEYQLHAFFYVARMAQQTGVDLWNYEAPNGRSLTAALNFLMPYMHPDAINTWPHQQISRPRPESTARRLLTLAIPAWPHEQRYRDAFRQLIQLESERDQLLLRFPEAVLMFGDE